MLALAALAGLALLLAWTAWGGAPDPAALAQEGATSTSTPGPPFTSPRSTPTFTRTPPPRPAPQPLRFITNPTEAYALGQRYYWGERPRGGEEATPAGTLSAPGEAVIQRSLFLPLVLTNGDWLWYKGAGKAHGYRPSGFMSQLGGSWWYDWQHDYTWGDYVYWHATMHAWSLAGRRCSMIFHPVRWVWPVGVGLALLVGLLALAGPGSAQAQQGPPVLPVCPQTDTFDLVFPSPFFDEDQTLFWVYRDVSRAGVLRSTDNGRTWFEVLSYSMQPGNPRITQFDIAPMRGGSGLALYEVVREAVWDPDAFHFLASENSGSTWQEGSSPCAGRDCYDYSLRAASRPGVLFQPRTWYSSVGTGLPEGVARTEDHGVTWQQVWAETPVAQVAISPNFDQDETLVAVLPYDGITNSNIIISHDAGETWHLGGGGLCPAYWLPQLTISPGFGRDRTLLLASDRSSLFMSEDAGLTWWAIFPPGGPFCDTSTGYGLAYVAFSPDYPDDPTIYAAMDQGLYASYDAGRSWILLVHNSSDHLTVRRAPNAGGSLPERTTHDDVRLTEDGHRVFLPLAAIQGSGPPYKPHTLFMQAQITGSNDIAQYRSDDGGRTWQCMTPPEVRTRAYLPLLRIRS